MRFAPGPSMSKSATAYPPSAKRLAIPAPIPAAAPVTIAVLLGFIFKDAGLRVCYPTINERRVRFEFGLERARGQPKRILQISAICSIFQKFASVFRRV